MKVIVDNGIKSIKDIISLLDGLDSIKLVFLNSSDFNNTNIKDADILLIRSTVQANELLLANTNIKLIGSATAGHDHIDIDYLKNNDIKWFYAPGCNALSVTNYVMSSIYFLIEKNIFNPNNTVGIIGYGNVGKQLKKALDYFSIKNFVYDPFLNFDFLSNLGLIKNCDLISLHVPLTNRTEFPTCNMIDKSFVEDIEGKTLVNTSRGGVVNESNLLNSNNINYVSDVWIDEPSPSNDIVDFSLLATPHIAGHSINGKMNGTIMLINFLQRYIGLEDRVKISNLEVIKQFISSSSYLEIEADHEIKKYKTEYDIREESDNFKKLYLNSERNFQKNIFSEVRSNHLIRLDIKT